MMKQVPKQYVKEFLVCWLIGAGLLVGFLASLGVLSGDHSFSWENCNKAVVYS